MSAPLQATRPRARPGGTAGQGLRRPRLRQGQSMVEYLVGLALTLLLLTAPFGGEPSVAVFFLKAVREGYARFVVAVGAIT